MQLNSQLWFAFKSFFYNIDYNLEKVFLSCATVVICFQKFLLQYWLQLVIKLKLSAQVVICFQKFLLQYWLQLSCKRFFRWCCCDLLSKVSFTILITTVPNIAHAMPELWFAFKSFFYNIDYNVPSIAHALPELWFAFKSFFYNIDYNFEW